MENIKIVEIEEGDSLYLQYLNYQIAGYEILINILSSNEECLDRLLNEYSKKYIETKAEFSELAKNLIVKYCDNDITALEKYDSIEMNVYGTTLTLSKNNGGCKRC